MTRTDNEYHISLSDMIMCLSGALDLVNVRISDHNEQVACISLFIAEALGMRERDMVDVTLAGLLHDIGALSLKEHLDLLNYDIVDPRRHAELGSRFLSTFSPLAHLAPLVRCHHAHWNNGEGRTVEGRTVGDGSFIIHLADRISILIDKSEEILSQTGRIIETIRAGSGTIYAPEHVEAFLSIADREFFWFISTSSYFEKYLSDRLRPLTVDRKSVV
jgi:response regulator RpfG family c-di-GMP phosphodiesterase